jgi:lysyl-tRNA synthetase class 2
VSNWLKALRTPVWVSRIVFLVGAIGLLSAYLPSIQGRTRLINEIIPESFPNAATTGGAAIGLLLIVLSRGLRRGKARAWWIALILTCVAAGIHLLRGLQAEQAFLCVLLIVLLLAARRNFTARPDPRSLRRVFAVLTIAPVFAVVIGWLWLTIDRHGEAAGSGSWDRLVQAVLGLVGIPGPISFTSDRSATVAAVGLAVLGIAVVFFAVTAAMAPSDGPHPLTDEEAERVRGLLGEWGWVDSLSYFATRDDRAVVFSPTGRSAVSYRVIGGVSFAAGDPLGHPDDWPQAVAAWLEEAQSYGWAPANLGVSERGAHVYHQAGLEVLEVGDEAILRVSDFTLEGRPMRGVRQAISRNQRAGMTAQLHRISDLTPQLRAKAIEWREDTIERGFAMALGRFGQQRDDAGLVVVARSGDDEIVGMLSFVPWGDDGLSLDLMRRSPAAPNGLIELMVGALMTDAERFGVANVSLNFAAFRSVFARGERLGAGPVLKAWRSVLMWASRFAQIEALYRANAKFRPEWVPRYLVYGDLTDLPRVGAAVLRAEAMLVAPTWWRRVSRSAPRAGAVEEIPEITVGHGPADASTQDAPPNPVTTGSQVPTQRSASAESTQEPGRSNQR